MQEEGGCEQRAEGRFLQCSRGCSDGVTHRTWGVGSGWEARTVIPRAERPSCARLMEVGTITAVPGGSERDNHSSPRRIPKG